MKPSHRRRPLATMEEVERRFFIVAPAMIVALLVSCLLGLALMNQIGDAP